MKNKKLGKYVVQCIKANKNKFGWGDNHKKGHFISHNGKGTFNIDKAHVYDTTDAAVYSGDEDDWSSECKKYYKCVPVKIVRRK